MSFLKVDSVLESLQKWFKPNPIVQVIDGRTYTVTPTPHGPQLGNLVPIVEPPVAGTLNLVSLSGFVDAYKAGVDDASKKKTAGQVIDHITVALVSLDADEFGRRHEWLRATCSEKNGFPFGEQLVPDKFLLALQNAFLPTENTVALQRLASSVTSTTNIKTSDDGFSQRLEMSSGTVGATDVDIPSRLGLFAYRTFREIDPTESDFMVRIRGNKDALPTLTLHEVDAGRWKFSTQLLVANYLRKALPEATVIA